MENSLSDWIGLPDAPLVVFENTPLVLSICQIRFPQMLSIAKAGFVSSFQDAIRSFYPVLEQGTIKEIELDLSVEETNMKSKKSEIWRFKDQDSNWAVALSLDFVSLETRSYQHFEDFKERLKVVLEALVTCIDPSTATRIGVRYINEIRALEGPWSNTINESLLGVLATEALFKNATHKQIAEQMMLRYPDRQGLNFRHGLFPQGTTVQPKPGQEAPKGPFYLLDFDAFREFPLPGGLPMDPIVLGAYVEQLHHAIYRLFSWSTTEEYRKGLGVLKND